MKPTPIKILLLISMLVLLCSCDPQRFLTPPYVGIWYIRNDATPNLYIRAYTINCNPGYVDSISVEPGDSAILVRIDATYEKDLYFSCIAQNATVDEDIYFKLYRDPEFKSLIKCWYGSEADNPTGYKSLFSESSWISSDPWHENLGDKKDDYYTYRSWTYTVTDDDLKAWEAGQ